ncbi:MAG TPA: sulfotransferase [Pseudomonadota bacterium]|nr:sulfotransferase [Pseudomonadota bacterium]
MRSLQTEFRPIDSPSASPIFVIGTGRSGTTLLRQMLNAHPNIYIAHESGFYSLLRLAPKQIPLRTFLLRYFDTFSFAWMRLDPRDVFASLPAQLVLDDARVAYAEILKAKATQRGKRRFGDKNPLDTQNLARIFSDFPDARVIFIVRHPVPTVQSFGQMPFGTGSPFINGLLCRIQYSHIKPFLDSILEVRLEDLSRDPRTTMQSILNFVGEPWDESVLDHVQNAQTDDLPPSPWFVGATKRAPNQREGAFRAELSAAWTEIVEWQNRETMQRYDYPTQTSAKKTGLLRCLATLIGSVPTMTESMLRLLWVNHKIVQHLQGKHRLDPQIAQRDNLMLNPAAWRYYPEIDIPEVPRPLLPDGKNQPTRSEVPLSFSQSA